MAQWLVTYMQQNPITLTGTWEVSLASLTWPKSSLQPCTFPSGHIWRHVLEEAVINAD